MSMAIGMVMAWVMGMVCGCRAAESRMALAVRARRVQVYCSIGRHKSIRCISRDPVRRSRSIAGRAVS